METKEELIARRERQITKLRQDLRDIQNGDPESEKIERNIARFYKLITKNRKLETRLSRQQ